MGKGIVLVKFLFKYVQSSNKINSLLSSKNIREQHAKRMEKLFWKTSLFYSSLTINSYHEYKATTLKYER